MFYTIYKITNKINNKFYIGKHQTKDINDGYMGSGKLIKKAIKKYGIDNFKKEILFIFNNEEEMNATEKELVIINEQSYNLCEGGKGGFSYINNNFTGDDKKIYNARKIHLEKIQNDISYRQKCIESYNRGRNEGHMKLMTEKLKNKHPEGTFKNRNHSKETKLKMSLVDRTGTKNSQYGTCWVTNGFKNKKIKKELLEEFILQGYYKGRK
jgi:hypothetical protein